MFEIGVVVVGFEFGHEGTNGVMLALVADVVADFAEVARANGEGTIAALPLEELAGCDFMGDEMGRCSLDLFHQVREAE